MERSDQGLERTFGPMPSAERDEIVPFHSHNTNLDDLENVQGFNSIGKRNELYCFKLTQNGMYIREPIENKNDVYNDYEIDIILKIIWLSVKENLPMVSCRRQNQAFGLPPVGRNQIL